MLRVIATITLVILMAACTEVHVHLTDSVIIIDTNAALTGPFPR